MKRKELLKVIGVISLIFFIFFYLFIPPREIDILFIQKESLIDRPNGAYLSQTPTIDEKIILAYYPGEYIPIDRLPENTKEALIAIEDKRFYYHIGIDPISIARAAKEDLRTFSLSQGGSTITQQLARNIYLGPEKTIKRKVLEALISIKAESIYSKEEILEFYFNYVYFGDELLDNSDYNKPIYGIEQASIFYFNKSSENLNFAETTFLISILRNPKAYNPYTNFQKTKERQEVILSLMLENGYITKEDYNKSINHNITLIPHKIDNEYVLEELLPRGIPINHDVQII